MKKENERKVAKNQKENESKKARKESEMRCKEGVEGETL